MRVVVVALLGLPASASACEFIASPLGYTLDGPVDDTARPSNVTVSDVVVDRGQWMLVSGGSCAPLGTLSFAVDAEDDWSDVGFVVDLVSGDLPDGMDISPLPFTPTGGRLDFSWWDTAGEPFEAVLSVSAMDRSGNEGLPIGVTVSDPGRRGCAVVDAPTGLGLWIAALLLLRRRR